MHQNYKHTKVLGELLGLNENTLFSVIVFVGDSTFKTEMPENVTYGKGYIRFIKSETQPIFSQPEVISITRRVESGRLTPSFKTNREHVKHVKKNIEQKANNKSCPTCAREMILREIKKGKNVGNKILGCSKFPKCRYAVKVA